ncbi:hypothetical protein [Sphingomonas sp. 28-63-12]|uniref:hypothetical protein n=1 Tax=Sphingomonas sp. 28-63-12 TaxID=1970434 RepID=UPI000BD6BBE8|nr:MAG: hypothetical protein B7Y47_02865 [Sphingomonas sp. 28-63-12]
MKHDTQMPGVGRELLAIASIALIGFVYLGGNWEIRSPTFSLGQVMGFGLVEQKGYGQIGSVLRAQVALPENKIASVSLSNGSLCRVGSSIEIEEAHTLFGSRFKPGLHECSTIPSHALAH